MTLQTPASVGVARRKVIAWMREQEAKGIYPYAWRSPDWDEYMRELFASDGEYARPAKEE